MAELLKLSNIYKTFPGVNALTNINFTLHEGEIHCICGENGAGKSTLIKIISGAYQPDEGGEIVINGNKMTLNPHTAMEAGIQTIYQEHSVFPTLNVIENLYAGSEIVKHGLVQKSEMRKKTVETLGFLECNINPDTIVSELSSSEQKMVCIARALVNNSKVLILDEPTASFSAKEIDHLLEIVKKLAADGMGIIYISHHLDEVFRIGTTITVIRDGIHINTYPASSVDEPALVRDMVGRDASAFYDREEVEKGDVYLEVENLCGNGVKNASFSVRRGEILGFAGMVGSGRSELMDVVFGAAPKESGSISIEGKEVNISSPTEAIKHKMCYITENRQKTGLFLKQSIARNTISANLVNSKKQWVSPAEDEKVGDEYIKKIGTKAINSKVMVGNLSGGNQQKVVLAKWFLTDGEFFIFDEPTRGIDVGAKQEIYSIMIELAKQGKAIIMVSSDMPEVISMSDRVMIMKDGEIKAELPREELSEENILMHSIGGSTI